MKNTTKAVLVALAVFAIIAIMTQATAIQPYYNTSYAKAPAMYNGHQATGTVSGRVTTSNETAGLADAFVALVNANNHSRAYYVGTTKSNGNYQFINVNNTWQMANAAITGDVDGYKDVLQVYANSTTFGEGYSRNIPVQEDSTTTANVVITPKPAKIVVTAERNNIAADTNDRVKIYAYVTDALGDAVADGTYIDFYVNKTNFNDADNGNDWIWDLNGSLSQGGNLENVSYLRNITTKGGWANVTFGWVNESVAGQNSTIFAAYYANYSVNGSTTVYFAPTFASWFGSVQDSYGKPYGGLLFTLHLMGYVNNDPTQGTWEVYNITTTSYVDLPYPGSYVFDNIEINSSVKYAYASAEADVGDGVTYYGKSNNYSLNKSRTSSGDIVLHVPAPDAIKLTADPDSILQGGDQ